MKCDRRLGFWALAAVLAAGCAQSQEARKHAPTSDESSELEFHSTTNSPFTSYDKKIVNRVQAHWVALIEKNGLYERHGSVTIFLQLAHDGNIRNARIIENSAGEVLGVFCLK